MKKILALVLALLMAFCLMTACGETDVSTDTGSANTDTSSNNTNSATDTTKAILTMATNAYFQPYEYYDSNQKIVGIDAEIAANKQITP